MPSDRPRRPQDPFAAAEAVFAKKKPVAEIKAPSLPNVRELVSLRIDRDVLEYFQADGPGWQDRMNDALRAAAVANGMVPTGTAP
ncbi:BrnA antitoxin family protein [Kaistia defluvii]|uniref:BrnA antitoxin family protein n=1 Tax=Kaistia defluvii TaxID=410841 RepID=UPI002250CEDB|nr:BrnA antitoxin family protein [Kaistia defluvii]MCX5517880.1 BrnA antitoxin family protein [Kaistia defluvii]